MCHCHQKKQTHPAPLTACFHPHLCASTNVCAANWSSLNLTFPSLPLLQVSSNLNPVHHITIQVFACTKEEAAERGGNKQDHVFQWWSWSMPAVRLCKAVGCKLESRNIRLTPSGFCSATLPLPLPDPPLCSHSHWQVRNCRVSRLRAPSQLKTNSTKKKKRKKKLLVFSQFSFLNQLPVQSLPAQGSKRRKEAGKAEGPILISLWCCGNTLVHCHILNLISPERLNTIILINLFLRVNLVQTFFRNLSSHSLPGHKQQEARPVHCINQFRSSCLTKWT